MTSVSGTRAPTHTTTPTPASSPHAAKPVAEDVRAMADAFASAGRRMGQQGTGQGSGNASTKGMPAKGGKSDLATRGEAPATVARPAPRDAAEARVQERSEGERHGSGEGFAAPQQAAPAALVVPQMPAPHVDPGAFAQMLANLWIRENGKGSKEVTVRFGTTAWPATGARLIRNTAGTLDIAVAIGDHAGTPSALADLRGALERVGLDIGTVAWEDDAVA